MEAHSLLPQVDWEAWYRFPWHQNNAGEDDKKQAGFWDKKAPLFSQKAHNPDHRRDVEHLLNRFTWDPSERVLDVGAGPGTFAIPLAQRVQHVTAIDASIGMLAELHKQASRESVSNISVTPGRWLSFTAGSLPKHDTVVCFNALGVVALDETGECHMGKAIERLREAGTRRGIILVPHADLPMDKPLRDALDIPENYERRERIAILYHIMVKSGLMPNLVILHRPFYWFFEDLQEGVQLIANRLHIADDQKRLALLKTHLQARLIKTEHTFVLSYPVSQALFWWEK
ncbi:MAG: class I SAM-dependent methyltransferase [Candidatus Ozemobacteraceae bacterium]